MTINQTQQKSALSCVQLDDLEWLPEVLDLHAQIHEELPEEKKHSFIVRGMDYFVPLLDPAQNKGTLMGVFDEHGMLLGMCSVAVQANAEQAIKDEMLTCTEAFSHVVGVKEQVTILQSLCLTKAAKGKGMASELIQSAIAWSQTQGVEHVFAQVAHDNPCGWVQLMRQGFDLVASWTAEHGRYLLHCGTKQRCDVEQTCITAKEEFYVGAAAHDDWINLFEDHLAKQGRIAYHLTEPPSKLLRFDLVV